MARYRIAVAHPAKARAARAHAYRLHPEHAQRIAQAPPPAVGTLWAEMDDTCPLGRPNCRRCGDPAFQETCRNLGHCPQCGTAHGIAPTSVLEAHGLTLVPAEAPGRVPDA